MYNKIRNWFTNNYKTIIRLSYVIPILFVAFVSISHVITWYSMTNPGSWAVYLSIGIEIAALSALAGLAVKNNGAIYLPFIIVTLIQFIGNTFFAFQFIDVNSKLFKDWVTLMDPFFSMVSMVKTGDVDSHRRWLALFGGALLPIISLSFLHLLVKFNDKEGSTPKPVTEPINNQPIVEKPTIVETPVEVVPNVKANEVTPTVSTPVEILSGAMNVPTPTETIIDPVNDPVNDPVKPEVMVEPAVSGNIEPVKPIVNDPVIENIKEEPAVSGNVVNKAVSQDSFSNNQIERVDNKSDKPKIFFRKK